MIAKKLRHELELVLVLSFMDLKLKYQNSVLGFFWSFIKPLLQFFTYLFIFGTILKVSADPDYPLQLFFGVLTWAWFSESTNLGMAAYINKQSIITKIKTNKLYPPIAAYLTPSMNYCLNLLMFIVAYILLVKHPPLHVLSIQNLLIIFESYLALSIIIISLNLILANLNVLYRDIQPIWELILNYGVFLTPIIYVLPIPERYATLYYFLNPLSFPIINLKSVFFVNDKALYSNPDLVIVHAVAILLLMIMARVVYKNINHRVVDFL